MYKDLHGKPYVVHAECYNGLDIYSAGETVSHNPPKSEVPSTLDSFDLDTIRSKVNRLSLEGNREHEE